MGTQGKKQVRSHCVSLTAPGHATAKILEDMVPEVRHPTPYALRPTPYTLHPTPYTFFFITLKPRVERYTVYEP